MPDLEPASTAWLIAYLLFSLVATVAVAAQAALQHASRPRLRLLAEGGLIAAKPVVQVLEEGSRVPTLLVVVIMLATGAAATCVVAAAVTIAPFQPGVAAGIVAAGALLHLVLTAVGRGIALARPESTAVALIGVFLLVRHPVLALGSP